MGKPLDSDGTPGQAKPRSRRRGEPRLGTDEESAAKIRDAIKASLARAHGEWVQLEERNGGGAAPSPPAEAEPMSTGEPEHPVAIDTELEGGVERRSGEAEATGELLREARERHGVTLDQASSDTRIARRYLEALEQGASAERFPSAAYARFFLRDYGRYLGIADHQLRTAYRSGTDDGDLEPLSVSAAPPRRRWATAAVAAAALIAVILLGVTRFGSPRREPLPAVPRSSPGGAVTAPSVAPTQTPTPTGTTEIVAVLRVSDASWVEAVTDGKTTLQKLLLPGSVQRLKAEGSLQLLLGNAGGIRLSINGNRVTTGAPGEVARLSFELRNGRVVTGAG